MRSPLPVGVAATICLVACAPETGPVGPSADPDAEVITTQVTEPHFNLNVVLSGQDGALGKIKFRQPVDAETIAYLNASVKHLQPNTAYQLQRAADAPDGICTSTAWLTLGQLLVPHVLTTNAKGVGETQFRRDLTAALGATFDIQFRMIDATTAAIVLQSGCYQFTVRQ